MKEQKAQHRAASPPVSGKYRKKNFAAVISKGKWFEIGSHVARFALSLLFLDIAFFFFCLLQINDESQRSDRAMPILQKMQNY